MIDRCFTGTSIFARFIRILNRPCRFVDGGGMAVFQAAKAFELFTGVAPDAERMLERFRSEFDQPPTSPGRLKGPSGPPAA
jgi:uncharacterized protein YbjT (DUF2867 family)